MATWYFACVFFCDILVETKATSVQGSFGGSCSLAVTLVGNKCGRIQREAARILSGSAWICFANTNTNTKKWSDMERGNKDTVGSLQGLV